MCLSKETEPAIPLREYGPSVKIRQVLRATQMWFIKSALKTYVAHETVRLCRKTFVASYTSNAGCTAVFGLLDAKESTYCVLMLSPIKKTRLNTRKAFADRWTRGTFLSRDGRRTDVRTLFTLTPHHTGTFVFVAKTTLTRSLRETLRVRL